MITKYSHHGMEVSVVEEYRGEHKNICMCHQNCAKFNPGKRDHCAYADAAFSLSKMTGIVLVMECKHYLPRKNNGS